MIDERYLEFPHWASQTTLLIQKYGVIPTVRSEDEWQRFGDWISSLPAFAAVNVPTTRGFPDWRSWARAFNQRLRTLDL